MRRQRAAGKGAGHDHGELAAGGQHRVDRHDREDRVGPVLRDPVGERLADAGEDEGVHGSSSV
jgi:hypothetical protein